jgi:hypothetical protein
MRLYIHFETKVLAISSEVFNAEWLLVLAAWPASRDCAWDISENITTAATAIAMFFNFFILFNLNYQIVISLLLLPGNKQVEKFIIRRNKQTLK